MGTTTAAAGDESDAGSSSAAPSNTTSSTSGGGSTDGGIVLDLGAIPDAPDVAPEAEPHLWYSLENSLVYIELDPSDGTVAEIISSTITNDPALLSDDPTEVEFNSLTVLDGGGLLGARALEAPPNSRTQMFYVEDPPVGGAPIEVEVLGDLAENIVVEGLYTDCNGRVYLMDTGPNDAVGGDGRFLRLTGDFVGGDLAFEVVADLDGVAQSPDLDDLSPGFDEEGNLRDNPGLSIDTGMLYTFDFTTGAAEPLTMAGFYGVHALAGGLFDDGVPRIYVIDLDGTLTYVDALTLSTSAPLGTGPVPDSARTGLAGPLTGCVTVLPE